MRSDTASGQHKASFHMGAEKRGKMDQMQDSMAAVTQNGIRRSTPETVDELHEAVHELVAATQDVLRAPDATIRALEMLSGRLTGIPFTALAEQESLPIVAGRAWINASTELIDRAVTAQHRTFVRSFAVQRQLVGQFVDIGSVLVGPCWPRR